MANALEDKSLAESSESAESALGDRYVSGGGAYLAAGLAMKSCGCLALELLDALSQGHKLAVPQLHERVSPKVRSVLCGKMHITWDCERCC